MSGSPLLLLDIAFRHLSGRRRQTIVAVSGVAIGVGFFLAVSALMIGRPRDFIIISDELRSPPPQPGIRAFPEGAVELHGFKVRNEVRGLKDWQKMLRAANNMPGVIGSPSLTGGVTLRVGGREEPLAIVGIEPEIETKISDIEDKLRTGELRDLERTQGGLIIGEELAERLGIGMGDIVGATSASGGTRSLRIVALFKRGQTQIGASTGYVLLREAQSLLARPFIINRIGIRLDDPYQAEPIAARLEKRFSYKAESWQERSSDFLSLLLTRNVIMYSVVSAILLVVSNSVADKRRDIAIMRSMGFSLLDLQLIFVCEGLALALVGIGFGWLLGFGLMQILGSVEFSISGESEYLPLDRGSTQYLIAGAASLFAGIIAAWLPARKAAQVDPVDILRGAA
jgi:lipoprotein-releasing system permease protein